MFGNKVINLVAKRKSIVAKRRPALVAIAA
jgi:hypothetical protein